jgi:hypothetical protein
MPILEMCSASSAPARHLVNKVRIEALRFCQSNHQCWIFREYVNREYIFSPGDRQPSDVCIAILVTYLGRAADRG